VKDVFALTADQAHAGEANIVLEPFVGKHSLLLLDGAEHMRQRKMMLPAFHGERMHAYGRTMYELAHDSIDRWPTHRRFAIHRQTQGITLQIILRTIFGFDRGALFEQLADVLTRGLDMAAWPGMLLPIVQHDFGGFGPWARFRKLTEQGDGILRGEIRRARSEGTKGRTDVMAMILDARDEAGEPLTEDEVYDELITLLLAGHETTATALAWAFRGLLAEPALVGKLREEIAGAHGDPQKIAKLELLDATVREALRVQPVIPMVGRLLREPMKIGRLDLPAGVAVAPSIYLVHRRPELYPDPEVFRPERFLTYKPATWEWLPFGGGLRRCIGAAFAIYEMKMVLAAILPRVDMQLATGHVRVVRRGITLTPSDGLPVVVTRKRGREKLAA
jgi:cytochrome P450